MSVLTIIDDAEKLSSLRSGPVEPLNAAAFRLTNPSSHLALQDSAGALIARCSVWRARDTHGKPTTAGLVGHYAAADIQAGNELLEYALNWHRADG